MSKWRNSSTWLKCALISLAIALCFLLIGLITISWAIFEYSDKFGFYKYHVYGLWNYKRCGGYREEGRCDEGPMDEFFLETYGWKDWFRATQAVECLGLVFMAVGLIFLFMYFFVPSFKQKNILVGIVVLTFASVVFVIIGVSIFGTKLSDYGYTVGWSMGLAITGAVITFIAGVMEVIELQSLT